MFEFPSYYTVKELKADDNKCTWGLYEYVEVRWDKLEDIYKWRSGLGWIEVRWNRSELTWICWRVSKRVEVSCSQLKKIWASLNELKRFKAVLCMSQYLQTIRKEINSTPERPKKLWSVFKENYVITCCTIFYFPPQYYIINTPSDNFKYIPQCYVCICKWLTSENHAITIT